MKKILFILILTSLFFNCSSQKNNISKKYVFYLHGRIVELQGLEATSPKYGKYEYKLIIDALKGENIEIISEIRSKDTKILPYAQKVVNQIDSLMNKGVSPQNITIIGASKGAIIAMQTATLLKNKAVNFVFIAGYIKGIESNFDFDLYGKILGFYEISDKIAGRSYQTLINKSSGVSKFKEFELNTNLGHGIVFKPLPQWIEPTKKWINN